MTYCELTAVANELKRFRLLKNAKRIDDNRLLLNFESESWLADIASSDTLLAPLTAPKHHKRFNAPFDQLLFKRLNQAEIINVVIDEKDKILRLDLMRSDRYKMIKTTLVLEMIPRRANALILDENGFVEESLRRNVLLNAPYTPPPKPPFEPKMYPIGDIRALLNTRFEQLEHQALERQKQSIRQAVRQRLLRLTESLNALEQSARLEEAARNAQRDGELILAHIDAIAPYSRSVAIADFDGTMRVIELNALSTAAKEAAKKFTQAKKLRAKAIGISQEEQNLNDRIAFYHCLERAIEAAQTQEALAAVIPQKAARDKTQSASEPIERFLVGGFTALLGRNEKGNALLLKRAKASDLWFHLKNRPSAHVILLTSKTQVPLEVIRDCATLCARFSLAERGNYEVDYTQRRNVKVKLAAQVTYTNYKSVAVQLS
ncbi:MAG: NFACT RNA binding domain-containing protein [Helicobacteraceae bacterium]|nr:NFACT RNA binding domain-containing protein [Helicobacteraceae bacterium]